VDFLRVCRVFPAEETLSEVHTLLHLARYDEAEAVSRAVLDPAHFAKPFDALILNFEIARQRQGHKVDKPRLLKIAERNRGSKEIGLCAHFLLDEKDRAADLMRKLVQKDRTFAYILNEWALFSTTPNKNWLTSTLSSKGLDPGIAVLEPKKAAV